MALQIPHAGLQLEEDFSEANAHLPTQSFILDLGDDVIDGMIEAANKGQEIRLSLGNKPTINYAGTSHRIEPTFEDETDDIEIFLTDPTKSSTGAERLPQLAMSLFRKPELGFTYPCYKTNSDEEEEEEGEYYEGASSPEADESDPPSRETHQNNAGLDTDIAALRVSMMQREAEKHEKSARVIEGSAHASNAKSNTTKRPNGSLKKALPGRRSPFGRTSLSPSPALSAAGSPSLAAADASSQNAATKARQSRSPIIHELAFKEQSYDNLWNKYPGSSEAEFRNALDKVADLNEETHNYVLRKKYWRELDIWRHDYASEEERLQAKENAIKQFDKMRLSQLEPEWDKLLPYDQRGQGIILSKVQKSIANGAAAPKNRAQKPDESSPDSHSYSGENGSGSNRTDEEGGESERALSPTRQGGSTGPAAKKKMSAREAQEKRLLSTKKRSTPAATASSSSAPARVSPAKSSAATAAAATAAASRASNAAANSKFKSKEFVTDSDSESGSESLPLAAPVHQTKLAAATVKSSSMTSAAKMAAANKGVPASIIKERLAQEREAERATPPAPPARKAAKPSPVKEKVKPQTVARPLAKKRLRDSEDDGDSSSGSSSGTPLSKRIKPTKAAPAKLLSTLPDSRDKSNYPSATSSSRLPPPSSQRPRASNVSPNGSSSSSGNGSSIHVHSATNGISSSSSSSKSKSNSAGSGSGSTSTISYNHTSSVRDSHNSNMPPTKSSPLAASPPTNASELDLSSEESVPPIGSSNTARKRKMVEASTNAYSGSKVKKHTYPQRSLPDDLVAKAQRFKTLYEKYAALYKDIASRSNPPKERVNDLLKMHRKLEVLKRDINEEVTMRD